MSRRGQDVNAMLSDRYCRSAILQSLSKDARAAAEITDEMIDMRRSEIWLRRYRQQIHRAADAIIKKGGPAVTSEMVAAGALVSAEVAEAPLATRLQVIYRAMWLARPAEEKDSE